MSVVVGAVTINAAFLQEIKEDNYELRELLETAARMFSISRASRTPPRYFVEVLSRLRDRLATHFALEEAFGYFEDAIEVAPRLSRQADELRAEHRALFLELCDLVEDAERLLYREAPTGVVKQLVYRYSAFRNHFEDHEARENELILDSLDCDLGVGD